MSKDAAAKKKESGKECECNGKVMRHVSPWIDFDSLLPLSFFREENGISGRGCLGSLDFIERENEYIVEMDAPGVDNKEVSITIRDSTLVVEFERKREERKDSDKDKIHWDERSYTHVRRSVRLPTTCDPEKVKTHFENGVLRLTFARRPEGEGVKKITL
eukprot:GHVP01006085.1.p1 GENE.GHVP01006085.1~~GHVP01006085.1.p1  ORF type:complete len:160 (+),score=28.17 GHVP01006085.1:2-481(+)